MLLCVRLLDEHIEMDDHSVLSSENSLPSAKQILHNLYILCKLSEFTQSLKYAAFESHVVVLSTIAVSSYFLASPFTVSSNPMHKVNTAPFTRSSIYV